MTTAMNHPRLERARRVGTALAIMSFPPLFAAIFAMHPHLLAFKPLLTLDDWTGRFHGRPLVHAAHAVMTLAVPLLVVAAFHFAHVLRGRGAWLGWIGGAMAVFGAVILAADKGALCLVTSAFDRLPEADYQALRPGLTAMHSREGWLALLWLLPLLPVGFAVQGVGLLREGLVGRAQGAAFILGSLLLANPDIEALSLIGSLLLTAALWPYGLQLLRDSRRGDRVDVINPLAVRSGTEATGPRTPGVLVGHADDDRLGVAATSEAVPSGRSCRERVW